MTNTCAHRACRCEVPGEQTFCSPKCATGPTVMRSAGVTILVAKGGKTDHEYERYRLRGSRH